jgi:glutathionyl-hydroquinone reductase
MGQLVDGRWTDGTDKSRTRQGRFVRGPSVFRNWITVDGSPGPTGRGGFRAEANRYHLYVARACPWAHRTLIFRAIKDLDALISVSIADARMPDETGWVFTERPDAVNGFDLLWQAYVAADPHYSGRATVPVLWDRQQATIVSNESAEIARMFNSAFNGLTGNDLDFYPEPLRARIDEINARVYSDINNGVYRAGFAGTQEAYEEAIEVLFSALDWADGLLAEHRYLAGETLTEADWRLLPTLLRFDGIYFGHFKCNRRRIEDYANLSRLLDELYRWPGIAETFDLDQTRLHYYWSHNSLNPRRIVPGGPIPAFLRI